MSQNPTVLVIAPQLTDAAAVTWPEHDLIAPVSCSPAEQTRRPETGVGGRFRLSLLAKLPKTVLEVWELSLVPWAKKKGDIGKPRLL